MSETGNHRIYASNRAANKSSAHGACSIGAGVAFTRLGSAERTYLERIRGPFADDRSPKFSMLTDRA